MRFLIFLLLLTSFYSAQESFFETYRGEIITPENGSPYLAGRISMGVKENVTIKRVEQLIKPFNGRIGGFYKSINNYLIDLDPSQRDTAIELLGKESDVEYIQMEYLGDKIYEEPDQVDRSRTLYLSIAIFFVSAILFVIFL